MRTYLSQLEYANKGIITPLVKKLSRQEGLSPRQLSQYIKEGKAVIPLNNKHKIKKPCAIGKGLSTKVNANLGTSTDNPGIFREMKKLEIAVKYGADTVMDLSVGEDIHKMLEQVLRHSPVPVGTVPIYEVAVNAEKKNGNFLKFNHTDILDVLEQQARQGVDFFTIHCGVTRKSLEALNKKRRLLDIVSRGGAIIANWIALHKKENPFYEYFDDILDIAHRYDATLSLGDGLRPGSILDATDAAQIAELKIWADWQNARKKRTFR